MAVWIYFRHYINILILYAVLTTFRTIGPFELNWDTQQYKCWISQYITFGLLASLQSLNLFWLYFVVKVAANMLFKDQIGDVRSDDEAEDEEDGEGLEKVEEGKKNGEKAGLMNGHKAAQKRVETMNGNTLKGTAPTEPSFAEVVEGKKER